MTDYEVTHLSKFNRDAKRSINVSKDIRDINEFIKAWNILPWGAVFRRKRLYIHIMRNYHEWNRKRTYITRDRCIRKFVLELHKPIKSFVSMLDKLKMVTDLDHLYNKLNSNHNEKIKTIL